MFKKEYRQVTNFKDVIVAAVCDECGREHSGNDYPDDWHLFSGQHGDWGNDSYESRIEYLACSPECYAKQLKKAVREFGYSNTAEIDEMTIDFAKRLVDFLNAL